LRDAVKSMPASKEVKAAPSIWIRVTSSGNGGSWKLPASRRLAKMHQRAVEPQRLGDPSPLVEEQVQVTVDGIEPEATHRAGERVK
jgi:hypothetical protein